MDNKKQQIKPYCFVSCSFESLLVSADGSSYIAEIPVLQMEAYKHEALILLVPCINMIILIIIMYLRSRNIYFHGCGTNHENV